MRKVEREICGTLPEGSQVERLHWAIVCFPFSFSPCCNGLMLPKVVDGPPMVTRPNLLVGWPFLR